MNFESILRGRNLDHVSWIRRVANQLYPFWVWVALVGTFWTVLNHVPRVGFAEKSSEERDSAEKVSRLTNWAYEYSLP